MRGLGKVLTWVLWVALAQNMMRTIQEDTRERVNDDRGAARRARDAQPHGVKSFTGSLAPAPPKVHDPATGRNVPTDILRPRGDSIREQEVAVFPGGGSRHVCRSPSSKAA